MARRKNISKQTRIVLAMLLHSPQKWQYGYEISKITLLKSGALYPILMRLHEQQFLEATWRESDQPGRPPRHIYRLTSSGISLANEQANDTTLPVISFPVGVSA
ncbi:MAG: PadR family transcriptional regulator [Robiginitomaculum sp.]|nr:PadR family transcriptional regulator [Robiginitomaculum sp.]